MSGTLLFSAPVPADRDAGYRSLADALGEAIVAASTAALRNLDYISSPDERHQHALAAGLERLTHLTDGGSTLATAFARTVQRAWERLGDSGSAAPVLERVHQLFTLDTPPLAAFRQVAVEELLLSNQPNLGRLLDYYRRDIRWSIAPPGQQPLRWDSIEPLLRLLWQAVLPHECEHERELWRLLPDSDGRALLDQARAEAAAARADSLARVEALLNELTLLPRLQQSISASEGSSISDVQVQQTFILGQPVQLPVGPPDLAALYQHYQGFLTETYGLLDFRGILQLQNVVRLRLEDIYVPLLGQRVPAGGEGARREDPDQPETSARWRRPERHLSDELAVASLHTFVRDEPFLVVLGDPGAGKSTLVRALLLALAQGQGFERFGLAGSWLPILFPVAAFAEARTTPGQHDLAPLEYLSLYYRGLSQPDYGPLFLRALQTGRALLLLDGLDEVRCERLALVRCLEAFVRQWDAPGNRFVATSRVAGYEDAPLDDGLFVRVLQLPLSDDGIRQFVAGWSSAYERAGALDLPSDPLVAAAELQRRVEVRAADLGRAVFTNPNVTTLARCPLLLTILALIHQQGSSMPDRRVDLYRLCVEALAETWNRSRSLTGREVDVYLGSEKLDERFVVNLLGPAALWMQEHQPGGLVERSDLEQQLARTLAQSDGLTAARARRLARSFIDLMQYDTGLLQERGYQRFGFLHLTFEEYLAARALLESVTVSNPDALVHQRSSDPAWREVLRLMVAAASQREAQRLLLHLLVAPTTPETYGRPVVLAGECLLDIGRNRATQRAWNAVTERLIEMMSDEQPPLDVRLAGGRVLGELGDPRLLQVRQGEAATDNYWCPVEAGPFWCATGHAAQPLREMTLSYSYQIARFPVTNSDYRCFIEAGGYQQPRWWTATGWAFVQTDDTAGTTDRQSQAINAPQHWQHPSFNGANQPVVGVSWYEAAAYCAWLTEQGHQCDWLPASHSIRLPTALEWERAARHTDQRHFPWGDDLPRPALAAYDATALHMPAPAGCFPAGAAVCGAQDLAGNVWEWTASLSDLPDHPAPCADVRTDEKPAIRGGAFNWSEDYLHCGAHYWFSPGYRQNLLGFRVIRVPEEHL